MDFQEMKINFGEHFARYADFIDETVRELRIPTDSQILDIGTGYGTMALILAYNGFNVITGEPEEDNWSQDHPADWLSLAQAAELDDQIHFQPFNAEELPFENERFDAIFMNGALHHIENKTLTLRECLRTLKPEGFLVIFEFTPDRIEVMRQHQPDHPDAVDPREFSEDMAMECKTIETPEIIAYIFSKNV